MLFLLKLKSGLIIGLGVIIVVIGTSFSIMPVDQKNPTIFHVTLASPEIYHNGVYSELFQISQGNYSFQFVPNGDSPEVLGITLKGESFSFSENFVLEGTLYETGISSYHTWDYLGTKYFEIPDSTELEIVINPHENMDGAVSVSITKKL